MPTRSRQAPGLEIMCADCGFTFTLSAAAIDFFEARGLTLPKRCGMCRAARRAARGDRESGHVMRFDPGRGRTGWGVIAGDTGERLVFVGDGIDPGSAMPLRSGMRVTFFAQDGAPLRKAHSIRVEADDQREARSSRCGVR